MKTTYLLGAGASSKAIPTISDLPKAIDKVADIISEIGRSSSLLTEYSDTCQEVYGILKDCAINAKTYGTIDTYCKALFLQDSKKLVQVKAALSVFFDLWQLMSKKEHKFKMTDGITDFEQIDSRYFGLLCSFLEKNEFGTICLPNDISFITWNYDLQIERALASITNLKLEGISTQFKVYPLSNNASNDSKIIHLNGIAGLFGEENTPLSDRIRTLGDKNFETILRESISSYHLSKAKYCF